jgi:hypothetical protein
MKYIFLFGHRQQHGKDTCANILETILTKKGISYQRTFFAKLLKKQVADRYNLNFEKMEDNEYKKWCPPHIKKKIITESSGLKVEVMRTVRDILIEEGGKGRDIWENTWANSAYMELFKSNAEIGFTTDFRYPNEYDSFSASFQAFEDAGNVKERPIPIKVLVHRPNGIFKNDGADGELPDIDPYWDYTIINEDRPDWKNNLENEVNKLLLKFGV